MNAAKVDVLAVMDYHAFLMQNRCETARTIKGHANRAKERDAAKAARDAVAELVDASGAGLSDLLAMVAAADRGEVWTVNAGTRLRLQALTAALARVGNLA